jgi:hypothetical protein
LREMRFQKQNTNKVELTGWLINVKPGRRPVHKLDDGCTPVAERPQGQMEWLQLGVSKLLVRHQRRGWPMGDSIWWWNEDDERMTSGGQKITGRPVGTAAGCRDGSTATYVLQTTPWCHVRVLLQAAATELLTWTACAKAWSTRHQAGNGAGHSARAWRRDWSTPAAGCQGARAYNGTQMDLGIEIKMILM